jgi:UDP-N-acetylglucosamine transferase subunit ALG13
MIFLTLGTQLPFDRLVQALDEIADQIDEPIFGQIGASTYTPKHFEVADFLTPSDFGKHFSEARVIVSHAGIGTILSGMKAEKPLLLMARRAGLGEHRNDHQLATVAQMQKISGIQIIENGSEMLSALQDKNLPSIKNQASAQRDALIAGLRTEIFGDAIA